MKRLDEVPINQEVIICGIQHDTAMKRRLMDLGFVKANSVKPVLDSPSKGMRAYLIKGCKIGLRKDESAAIMVCNKEDYRVV